MLTLFARADKKKLSELVLVSRLFVLSKITSEGFHQLYGANELESNTGSWGLTDLSLDADYTIYCCVTLGKLLSFSTSITLSYNEDNYFFIGLS